MKWLLLVAAILLNSVANILLKKFSSTVVVASPLDYLNPWFIAGLACFGINVLLYAKALEALPLGIAYPVLVGLSVLIVTLASTVMFRSPITPAHMLGTAMILGGAIILVRLAN
jgi:multidrug transporter EmrE-like cation transporter